MEEARAALLPAESLAALSAEVQAYQADYAEALAVCQQLEDGEESEVFRNRPPLVVRRPRGSGALRSAKACGSSVCPTPEQSRAGASLPAPAPFTSRPPPGRLFCDRYDLFAPLASPDSVAPMWLPSPKLPSPQHHPALQHFREGATYLVGSCTKYRSAMEQCKMV